MDGKANAGHDAARPTIATSACMLGHRVRFDGAAKRSAWVSDVLAKHVDLVTVCPEMSMGFGAPREAMRLVREAGDVRLAGTKSGADFTAHARKTAAQIMGALPHLDGALLQKNSPTCGVERVRVYDGNGVPARTGQGLFAGALVAAFPTLPVVEEGRLHDDFQRAHYLTRIFAMARLRAEVHDPATLQRFHTSYKMLLYAHSPEDYRAAGRAAAASGSRPWPEALAEYRRWFAAALAVQPSVGRRINAFQHIMGFFKRGLGAHEKQSLLQSLESYRAGLAPFSAPLMLLQFLAKRFESEYIQAQRIFDPYPAALAAPGYF